jgi:hypothetical protein
VPETERLKLHSERYPARQPVTRDLLQLCADARRGERLDESSFDLDRVYLELRRLTHTYDIDYTPDDPVPADDALADRVWDAAVEFFVTTGVYFKDLGTVLRFSREEIDAALAAHPGEAILGEGDERRAMRPRKPDSDSRPWCHVGSGTVASSEEIASQIVYGNASIAAADSMSVNALDDVDGSGVVAGEPSEIRAAIRSLRIARAACARAGREGLPIANGVAAAGTVTGTFAAANPFATWRSSDGLIVGSLAEMKTNLELMTKAEFARAAPCVSLLASAPILGGFGGGPEAVAILNAAYVLFGLLVYHSDYYLSLPMHVHRSCTTTRDLIWASAVSCQAIARNTPMPTLFLPYVCGGPMTESCYFETAAATMTAVASGVSIQTTHPARALIADHVTPMDMRFAVEVALGTVGMTRADVSPVVRRLLDRYEPGLAEAGEGKAYSDCYNLDTAEPTDTFVAFVADVKNRLAGLGVRFGNADARR